MEALFRAAFMYIFLMFIIRISGKRTLSEMTTFDLVLLLVIGDASQQAIASNDYSVTNAVIIISTFIVIDMLMAMLKNKFRWFDRVVDGTPLVIVANGKLIKKFMQQMQINEEDILEAARKEHGLARMEQIKFAVLEKDGSISIIPEK